jgi:hypothetical protein
MIFYKYSRSVDLIIYLHFLIDFCRIHQTAAFSSKLFLRHHPLGSRTGRVSSGDRRSLPLFSTKRTSESPSVPPNIEFSDFWGTSIRNEVPTGVPCIPSLDPIDGPLPPGAYQIIAGDSHNENDLKPTCRISVAPDLNLKDRGELDPKEIVRNLQRSVDAGFQTLQLASPDSGMQAWGEEEIFGRLWKETPAHVTDYCNVVVPLAIPGVNSVVSTNTIRQSVFDKLARTRGDAIDTLLLERKYGDKTRRIRSRAIAIANTSLNSAFLYCRLRGLALSFGCLGYFDRAATRRLHSIDCRQEHSLQNLEIGSTVRVCD